MKKLLMTILVLIITASSIQASNADTLTVADLRKYVYNLLNDKDRTFWTTDIVDRFLDLSCREYALMGGIERIDSINITQWAQSKPLNDDFLKIKGVVMKDSIGSTTGYARWKALKYRALRSVGDRNDQTLGGDHAPATGTKPEYYSIFGVKDTILNVTNYHIALDPPQSYVTPTELIIVFYYAQSVDLISDSTTVVNIPYSAVPLVVYNTVRMCFMMNREDAFAQMAYQWATDMYQLHYAMAVAERSDPDFIPTERPR